MYIYHLVRKHDGNELVIGMKDMLEDFKTRIITSFKVMVLLYKREY